MATRQRGAPPLTPEKFAERFWSKVDQRGASDDWQWNGRVSSDGHAIYSGRMATRLAWELTNGSVPASAYVIQRCGNRLCVNPAHLFLGTISDAMAAGGSHAYRKLSEGTVREIRAAYAEGASRQELADRYGLSDSSSVGKIVRGDSWKHLEDTPTYQRRSKSKLGRIREVIQNRDNLVAEDQLEEIERILNEKGP